MDRKETIKRIRAALKRRSGKAWSVTGGRGTAHGWLTISAPPARCIWEREYTGEKDIQGDPVYKWVRNPNGEFGYMGPDDARELADLLGKPDRIHCQGESVPASHDYWQEYIDRAEGRTPAKCGVQYWD